MGQTVALTHRTRYRYDRLIAMGPQLVRLRPAPHCRTPIRAFSLTLEPKEHFLNWQQDPFGNWQARIVVPERTREFSVTVDLVAEMAAINPFDFFVEDEAKDFPFTYDTELAAELAPYLGRPQLSPDMADYAAGARGNAITTIDFLIEINRRLASDIAYLIRLEPGVQSPDDTLRLRSGSCRDSSWLLVQLLRAHGLAARFVSGYLIQLKADTPPVNGGAPGPSADFTDLHAWAEAYIPGAGWVGLDPTSGLLAGEGHIPLAATPAPSSAAPISGAHDRCEVEFDVEMSVARLEGAPRTTLPYAEQSWDAILAAGDIVDARLAAADVRLTMGGEPTFISATEMDAPEWNTAAEGGRKRTLSETLIRRLGARVAAGGLLHFGQGKWYPGEALPRWALALHWRHDGEPIWQGRAAIADETAATASATDAHALAGAITRALGFPDDACVPAYEDPIVFARAEGDLPENVDIRAPLLGEPAGRERLRRVLETGVTAPAAFVLPLKGWAAPDGMRAWISERWPTRRRRLFLTPGDSAAGFRLPIGALPEIDKEDWPHIYDRDPSLAAAALAPRAALPGERAAILFEAPREKPAKGRPHPASLPGPVRTALVVEARGGRIHVFLPPMEDAHDTLALIAAVEDAAAAAGLPVIVEGYGPPHDRRLGVLKVTPDPGVIEVNVAATASWREMVGATETLYAEAAAIGLAAEKFLIDGRHAGTGGGNHVVIGGATPEDSPFLRRPDLLASLITYWQHHPALSYVFSGLFIGPTSQAPRIDEARHEALYEMEIALAQVPPATSGTVPPWLVDRLFRNLLVDVTGNTHRAEICIDKLFAPELASGRLGLVEFRGFEMPPHPRLALAQALLVRAILARLWEAPYRRPLVRWGTALADRWMLPAFLAADLAEVCEDLDAHGLAVDPAWFAPHLEFRFPVLGEAEAGGVRLTLRQALEAWPVMGEENSAAGTARYVDSSLERVEVRASGLVAGRHIVSCNGRALPLARFGADDIAGVRYRAWLPGSCLHPNIEPHTPLVFDVFDAWSGRSLGGCRYHVSHPGGRAHDTLPVNAAEAEGRRLARFEAMGHTPGAAAPAAAMPSAEFPHTLDLRRPD